jgi:hypothetical protein
METCGSCNRQCVLEFRGCSDGFSGTAWRFLAQNGEDGRESSQFVSEK